MILADVTNLLYMCMAAVERYVNKAQLTFYDDFSLIVVGLFLFMLLASDLGLIMLTCHTLIMTAADLIYLKLSGSWARWGEDQQAMAKARILDLVVFQN